MTPSSLLLGTSNSLKFPPMRSRLGPLFLPLISCGAFEAGALCQQGDEDCPCFDDLTCNTGFNCVENKCEIIEDQSSSGSGNTTSNGGTGTSTSTTTASSDSGGESCAPDQSRCEGDTVQHCNAQGLWEDELTCRTPKERCQDGSCVSTCEPWNRQLGNANSDHAEGIAVDPSGNIYIAGDAQGAIDGQNSTGSWDILVAKYDDLGIKLWTRLLGTSSYERALDIAVDGFGNAYVTGFSDGNLGGQDLAGDDDIFIAKFNPNGILLWTRLLGTPARDWGTAIAIDQAGHAYVTGDTLGGLDGQPSAGGSDTIVAKFDSDGNELWFQFFGTLEDDTGQGIEVDDAGNVYITGMTEGSLDTQISAGKEDIFVAKFNTNGSRLWIHQFGSTESEQGLDISIDHTGNAFVTGYTEGSLDGQTFTGQEDIFVTKFNASGLRLWTQQFGTSGKDESRGIALDASGNAFITGYTTGNLDAQASDGLEDTFVTKFNSDGIRLWTQQFGTSYWDESNDIAVDHFGRITVTGFTQGTFPGNTSAGDWDVFVARICDND